MQKWLERFSPRARKAFLIAVAAIGVVSLFAVVYIRSVRQEMLDGAVVKIQKKLADEYRLTLKIGHYGFDGLMSVKLDSVEVIPDSSDRLLYAGELGVAVKLFPLLRKRVVLDELDLHSAEITLVKKDSSANYDFIFNRKSSTDTVDTGTKVSLAQRIDRFINQAFEQIPDALRFDKVKFSYQDSSGTQAILIPTGEIAGNSYDVDVFLDESDAKWNLSGRLNRRDQNFSVTITADNPNVEVPVLRNRFGLAVNFEELTFDLQQIARHSKEKLKLVGSASFKGMKVNHRRLSENAIILPDAKVSGEILVSENSLEILKSTEVTAKDFTFHPYVKYIHRPVKELELSIHAGTFAAQTFFDALPKGLFHNLDGVQVEGDISYDLDFAVNFELPDSLKFVSKVNDKALKVTKWGAANIAALNEPFVHKVIEDTLVVKEMLIGPGNPDFVTLGQISPILKTTVLNSEDPFFYEHKGFEEEAFKLSIVTNIKEKAFKRGASTISMQLVKNLFLHHNKTMMRKLEEILLVWLMEQSGVLSKDRLLEIYFNIIELGNDVYGISEGAKYYFGKKPAELNIGESLFISSIIPKPKRGLDYFDYTGHLLPQVRRHFNTYGYIMNKRGQLTDVAVPEAYGFYGVQLVSGLRPPRPKNVVDTMPSIQDLNQMVDEMDEEQRQRRILMERMFGKSDTLSNN